MTLKQFKEKTKDWNEEMSIYFETEEDIFFPNTVKLVKDEFGDKICLEQLEYVGN